MSMPRPINPQAQVDVEPRRPVTVSFPVPVVTTETLPGHEIVAALGTVIGVTTRPRDLAFNPELAYVNTTARQDAIGAMALQAQELGADAVVAMRFDGGKVSDTVSELAAYGTAVKVVPLSRA